MAGSTTPYKVVKNLPTHLSLADFILALLPLHPRDVPPLYHQPRHPGYNPAAALIRDVVLSITPTPGVYQQLTSLSLIRRPTKPVCFLHRPFNLDRYALPRGTLVQASHKRFDELLTVGWNVALAEKLGLDLQSAVCIQGYKGDSDRRIGLVAKLHAACLLKDVHDTILREFGKSDMFPPPQDIDLETRIDAIAIMNAFGADEVARAMTAAVQARFVGESDYANLLYLTGEPKDAGLATIKAEFAGMSAVCVGHRAAEEWGIKHLAALIKQTWSDVNVHMVFEEEEEVLPKATPVVDANVTCASSDKSPRG